MSIKPNIPKKIKANNPKLTQSFTKIFVPDPKDKPLADIEYTGEIEADAETEVSAVLSGFKARAKAEEKRFELATDSEFWFAVCFQSREQKEVFLEALNWSQHGGGQVLKWPGNCR